MKVQNIANVLIAVVAFTLPAFAGPKSLTVTTTSFLKGEAIPAEYACTGADISPQLAWSKVPKGTKSVAVVLSDPDAPSGTFFHWGRYNIAPSASSLPVGATKRAAKDSVNDFGYAKYNGPCPPIGQTHRYRFSVFALSKKVSGVKSAMELYSKLTRGGLKSSVLASGFVSGTFQIDVSSLNETQCLDVGASWRCTSYNGATSCLCSKD